MSMTNAEFQAAMKHVEVALTTIAFAPLQDMQEFVRKAAALTPRYKPDLWENGGREDVERWAKLVAAAAMAHNATDGVDQYLVSS